MSEGDPHAVRRDLHDVAVATMTSVFFRIHNYSRCRCHPLLSDFVLIIFNTDLYFFVSSFVLICNRIHIGINNTSTEKQVINGRAKLVTAYDDEEAEDLIDLINTGRTLLNVDNEQLSYHSQRRDTNDDHAQTTISFAPRADNDLFCSASAALQLQHPLQYQQFHALAMATLSAQQPQRAGHILRRWPETLHHRQ
eukprot:TRINITY_DN6002_c0_g1_i1.p1 TRINITY_DN6002_c0_g1~~TRINITY_DN6002_c0_g1_i1.p1  ORF type:complete len:195 (+),score=36.99 TRINITY_DN6002_c0_g1_i1:363-947(+)